GPTLGRPGLRIFVRQVETSSFDTNNPSLYFSIPAVPGLKQRPDAAASNFLKQDPVWVKGRALVAYTSAVAANSAAQAATAIDAFQLETWQNSEIYGGVSALAEIMPSGPKRIVIFSDLEQNQTAQVAGDLHGASIVVVQPCNDSAS